MSRWSWHSSWEKISLLACFSVYKKYADKLYHCFKSFPLITFYNISISAPVVLPAHFPSIPAVISDNINIIAKRFFPFLSFPLLFCYKNKNFFLKSSELWQNFNILFSFHLFFAPQSLRSIRQAPADQGSSLPQTDWSAKVKSSIRILLHKDIIPLSFPGCIK